MVSARCFAALAAVNLCGAAPADDFDPWTQTARYELEYSVKLDLPAFRQAESVRVWLPTPAENAHQKVLSKAIEVPWPYRQTQDRRGNRFVYVEFTGEQAGDREMELRFVVARSPAKGIRPADARANTPLDPRRYLGAQRRIPLAGRLSELAARVGRGCRTDGQRIRAFYDYVTRTMRYSKQGVGWGRGDALWACDARYGNCTDFHSVFIGMARAAKIAARFKMGFPIPADKRAGPIGGYHCWAEAYDPARGWIPVDASEAWKSKRFDDYFGALPSDRVEFTLGRDLVLEPPQQGEPLNFFIYPYAEADGRPVTKVPWKLRFRRVANSPTGD